MTLIFKLLISIIIIIVATQTGRYFPSLSGLIATMPLTGAIVLIWLYFDNPDNLRLMEGYAKGALWGIIPSALFFLTAYLCFRKDYPLTVALTAGFAVWPAGAFVHQMLLK